MVSPLGNYHKTMGFSSSFDVLRRKINRVREVFLRFAYKKKDKTKKEKQEILEVFCDHASANDKWFPWGFVDAQERISAEVMFSEGWLHREDDGCMMGDVGDRRMSRLKRGWWLATGSHNHSLISFRTQDKLFIFSHDLQTADLDNLGQLSKHDSNSCVFRWHKWRYEVRNPESVALATVILPILKCTMKKCQCQNVNFSNWKIS